MQPAGDTLEAGVWLGAPRATVVAEVIAVFGPTGSGKTSASEIVARALGTEIVSADALQVYRGLPILTNQSGRATRLVAIRDLSQEFSVGEYARLAHAEIDELVGTNGIAVVWWNGAVPPGGDRRLDLPPAAESSARARWEALYDGDPDAAYARLGALDAAAASRVHLNDRRRVVRALELAEHGDSSHLRAIACGLPTRDCRRSSSLEITHFSRAQDP